MEEIAHISSSFSAFDTTIVLDLWGAADGCMQAARDAERLCHEFEGLFSRTLPTSDVGRLNATDGDWVRVDPRTAELVQRALGYCERSGDIFDITVGPAIAQWDFKRGIVPDEAALAEAVAHVGWEAVEVDEVGCRVRLGKPGMMIDLGGIAKGWIADRLLDALLDGPYGLTGLIANLGGNVVVGGAKPDGTPWLIGVKDPVDPSKRLASIPIEAGSIVTSGTYERSFECDGRLYHHVLDSKTGWPVPTDLASATLVCKRSIDAEGFSTTVLALGKSAGIAFAKAQPEIEHACLVGTDGELLVF